MCGVRKGQLCAGMCGYVSLYHTGGRKTQVTHHMMDSQQMQENQFPNRKPLSGSHTFHLLQANVLTFVTVSSSKSRRTSALPRPKTLSSIFTFGITVGCIYTRTHDFYITVKNFGSLFMFLNIPDHDKR